MARTTNVNRFGPAHRPHQSPHQPRQREHLFELRAQIIAARLSLFEHFYVGPREGQAVARRLLAATRRGNRDLLEEVCPAVYLERVWPVGVEASFVPVMRGRGDDQE